MSEMTARCERDESEGEKGASEMKARCERDESKV